MDSAGAAPDQAYAIGDVEVIPGRLVLQSPLGQSQLEPKVMQLLQALVARAGETIHREELIDTVWGLQYGGDESLTRAVSLLRKALQVPHGVGNLVRTIPRRGYLLDAKISKIQTRTDAKSSGDTTAKLLLAVLPFDNLSSDPETQFFSDGVTEDIIERLIRGTDLKVIGRTSSFQFRDARKSEAASELGATHLVDGSVRRAGNRVRISVHLEQSDTRETLWSERYDRDLEDILAVQDEISEQIAVALDLKMEAQRQSLMAPAVYDLYLQGREWTYSTHRLSDAIDALEKVTIEAPDFAPAWGALARNRAMMRMYHPIQMRRELDDGVREAIDKALALDSQNRDALNAVYQRLDHFGPMLEHHDAISDLRRFKANSGTGLFLVSFHETCIGRLSAAYDIALEGARLDPLNPISATYPAIVLSYSGNLEKARRTLEANLKRWPGERGVRAALIITLASLGDAKRLSEVSSPEVLQEHTLGEFSSVAGYAEILVRNDPVEMKGAAEIIAAQVLRKGSADLDALLWISQLGQIDRMYETLDRVSIGPTGAADDDIGTVAYRTTLLFGYEMRSARADPRFMMLCARLGLVRFWLETGIRPDFADEIDYDFEAECRANADVPIDTYNPFSD